MKRLKQIPGRRLIKKVLGFDEIYTVAFRKRTSNSLLNSTSHDKNHFISIPYSSKFWYADPLVFQWCDKEYLFVEEYDRKLGKGRIAVAAIDENKWEFVPVIQEHYHMSFPMVFEWNETVYMIPETSENKSINIYKAIEFPYKWSLLSSIRVDALIVDTVVVEMNENSITFLSSESNPQNGLEVKFFKWTLENNDLNKIIVHSDFNSRQAFNLEDRNAGIMFKNKTLRILPTQFSSPIDYGVGLAFRNADDFSNEIYGYITPDLIEVSGIGNSNIIGIHTFSQTQEMEIIDVRYLKFAPIIFYSKLLHRLKRK